MNSFIRLRGVNSYFYSIKRRFFGFNILDNAFAKMPKIQYKRKNVPGF